MELIRRASAKPTAAGCSDELARTRHGALSSNTRLHESAVKRRDTTFLDRHVLKDFGRVDETSVPDLELWVPRFQIDIGAPERAHQYETFFVSLDAAPARVTE